MVDAYIDVGHSAASPGAVGFDGRTEHAEGLELAHLLAPELRRAGITYSMDLSGNDPGYRGSTDRANRSGARVVIELHRDWRGSAAADAVFALHATDAGERLGAALVAGMADEGLPVWRDGTVDEDSIGRHGLVFLNQTTAPAVILELGKIRDYPDTRNRAEARGIADGLARYFGKPTDPRPTEAHRDVAVAAIRRPDLELAQLLGAAHDFAVVEPRPDGRWLQTYAHPDGKIRQVVVDTIGYLVAIGYRADELVARVGAGVAVTGPTSRHTAVEVARLARAPSVSRSRPFA